MLNAGRFNARHTRAYVVNASWLNAVGHTGFWGHWARPGFHGACAGRMTGPKIGRPATAACPSLPGRGLAAVSGEW